MGFKGLYQVGLGYSHNFPLKLDGHAQDGPRAVPCLGVLRRDGLTYALHTLGQRRQPLMMEPCSSKPVPAATQSPTLAHVAVEAGVAVRVGDVERLARRRDVPRDALRDGHPRHATAARHHWGGGVTFLVSYDPKEGRPFGNGMVRTVQRSSRYASSSCFAWSSKKREQRSALHSVRARSEATLARHEAVQISGNTPFWGVGCGGDSAAAAELHVTTRHSTTHRS